MRRARCSPTPSAGDAGDRRRRQRLARRLGRRVRALRSRRARRARAGGTSGTRAAPTSASPRTRAPVVAVLNPDTERRRRAPRRAMLARLRRRARPRGGRAGDLRNPDGTHYPSARPTPSPGDAVGHALLGLVRPANRFTRRYRQLDVDPAVPRDVDWVSGAAVWLRRVRARRRSAGGTSGTSCTSRTSTCAGAFAASAGVWPTSRRETVMHVQGASTSRHPYRMIVAHHRSAYRFGPPSAGAARAASCCSPPRCSSSARAGVVMAARALGARPGRPRVTG